MPNVSTPNFLVLSGTAPGENGVGAILLKQILESVPRQSLTMVVLLPKHAVDDSSRSNEWIDHLEVRRYEHAARPRDGVFDRLANQLAFHLFTVRTANQIAERIIQKYRSEPPNEVVAILDCPMTIWISKQVADRLGKPLRCFVMDGPESHSKFYGITPSLQRKLTRQFDETIQSATKVAVAGESMKLAYERQFGVRGIILRQGIPNQTITPDAPLPSNDTITIGFAGSITASDAFASLIQNLNQRSWSLSGRQVKLRVIGSHLRLKPDGPQHIEYLGWRSVDNMIELLQGCDILYLPQPFGVADQEIAKLSFPNKVCTYVPVDRPIALHAPPYASLHAFFDQFHCGPVSSKLDASELLDMIGRTCQTPELYQGHVAETRKAHAQELNMQRLQERSREFLSS